MSAGVAPGEIIIAIGSPGTTRSSTNTMIATPSKVTAAMIRRWAATDVIDARATRRQERARTNPAVPRPRSAQALDTNVGCSAPVAFGDHLERCLVDDGLRVLHERNHIALFGDIFVDRLPAGDALCFVLLSPQWPDHVVEILRLPGRVRRRREHRKSRRGGRVADRIAPIVEGHRIELVAGAQLIVLGDLVNLDLGVDSDLAPHPDNRLDHFVIFRLEAARRLDLELDRLFRRVAALGEKRLRQLRVIRRP